MDRGSGRFEVAQAIMTEYDGDAEAALHDLANMFHVAAAWLDRDFFDDYVRTRRGTDLTDPEWESVKPELGGFDEWVAGTSVSEDFTRDLLARCGVSMAKVGG